MGLSEARGDRAVAWRGAMLLHVDATRRRTRATRSRSDGAAARPVPCACATRLHDSDSAVVVAVSVMWTMQVAGHQVVDVIPMWYGRVAAVGTVHVIAGVGTTLVVWRAGVGIRVAHSEDVLVDMAIVRMVQVAVVQIVDVALVVDGLMATALTVLVSVVGMDAMVL